VHDTLNVAVDVPRDGLVYGVSDHDITVVPYSEQ